MAYPAGDPAVMGALRNVGPFQFLPLVTDALHLRATLDILLLRPEPPGAIVVAGGDIDDRLKTLFDALRVPVNADEVPPADAPGVGETPLYCLLEDDRLITGVSVATDRLLDPPDQHQVHMVVHVHLRATTGLEQHGPRKLNRGGAKRAPMAQYWGSG